MDLFQAKMDVVKKLAKSQCGNAVASQQTLVNKAELSKENKGKFRNLTGGRRRLAIAINKTEKIFSP